jgi:YfiH family protein
MKSFRTPLERIVPDWPAARQVRAVCTTRGGGVSRGAYASLNLATHVGDDGVAVARNRAILRSSLDLPAEPLWLEQVHGLEVVDVDRLPDVRSRGWPPRADGALCGATGRVCAVLTADCMPVLLSDRAGTRVAALHAGWRGLAAGVVEAGVRALGRKADEILAWLGPAIGPNRFQVGDEVRTAFVHRHQAAEAAFRPCPQGRWLADLYALARIRLSSLGVEAVYGGHWCTYEDSRRFYSYRREPVTGRMATLIWLSQG